MSTTTAIVYPTRWTLTDGDTNQWGRQLDEKIFEFREDGKEKTVINLSEYSEQEQENCINSYGYTLYRSSKAKHLKNIHKLYGKQANWIIAECLFESL